jgi:tRNA A-37 threonylcarbamoyl transferase component Bud32
MNDIYQKKAKKYKYKYLKLKKELEGGMRQLYQPQPSTYYMQQPQSQQSSIYYMRQPQTRQSSPYYMPQQNSHPQFQLLHMTRQLQQQLLLQQQQQAQQQARQQPWVQQPSVQQARQLQQQLLIQQQQQAQQQARQPTRQQQPSVQQPSVQPWVQKQEYISSGLYSCVVYPPINYNYISKQFPSDAINLGKFINEKYIGKLLNKRYYDQEFEQHMQIKSMIGHSDHISNLVFAGEIDLNSRPHERYMMNQKSCIKLNNHNIINYIIYKYVGDSFMDLINKKIIENINLKVILLSLINAIKSFINKIYINDYVHGDLNHGNITLYNNNKVYFIDFGLMHQIDINIQSKIDIFNVYRNSTIGHFILLYLYMYNDSNDYNNPYNHYDIKTIIQFIIPKIINDINLNNQKFSYLFQSYKILVPIINLRMNFTDFIIWCVNSNPIIANTPSSKFTSRQQFYNTIIRPIAKNFDIYSLSIFIYYLIIFNPKVNLEAKQKACGIFIDALQNKINGPGGLIAKIEDIKKII